MKCVMRKFGIRAIPMHKKAQLSSNHHPQAKSQKNAVENAWRTRVEPYRYSSGRWLHNDKLQHESRFIDFNFSGLCEKILRLHPQASSIVDCEKLEGGFNRVFIFTLDHGLKVIAKLPTRVAGPRKFTTNSEVATMTYLQSFTSIPIPKILGWSDEKANLIGSEYIIMEHAGGTRLHERWAHMNILQHLKCTTALSSFAQEMAKLEFLAYGSLYFEKAIAPELRVEVAKGYCIGPHCGYTYWNSSPGETELYGGSGSGHGPWQNLMSYSAGLIETGLSRLPRSNVEPQLPHLGSVKEHVRLLSISREMMAGLVQHPPVQKAAAPTLFHCDYHKRNIYVSMEDPTVISGIIDWQSTSIEPAFVYVNEEPDFAASPDDSSSPEDEEEAKEDRMTKYDAFTCSQMFNAQMNSVPKLQAARNINDTLFRLFLICHTSWRDSATHVRQELIELSQHWVELGLRGSPPYVPTEKELLEHKKLYKDFRHVQELKSGLIQVLGINSDGWVQKDRWEEVYAVYQQLYQQWLEDAETPQMSPSLAEDDMTVEKARQLWPFDQR